MKVNQQGLTFLIQEEGEVLRQYYCSAGVATIGVGHTGPDVKPGMRITREQSQALLSKDIVRFEAAVNKLVKVPLTQAAYNSLVSFCFNLGEGALAKSSLLRYINQGAPYEPAQLTRLFGLWQNVNGVPNKSIYNRRVREARLFLS